MLVVSIPQYVQGLTNAKADLTTTGATVLYTAPSGADFNSSVINSIIVCDDSNNGSTITITVTSADNNVFVLFDEKSISGHATVELLTRDLILQSGEVITVTAGDANRLHVVASIQEFALHRTPQSAL